MPPFLIPLLLGMAPTVAEWVAGKQTGQIVEQVSEIAKKSIGVDNIDNLENKDNLPQSQINPQGLNNSSEQNKAQENIVPVAKKPIIIKNIQVIKWIVIKKYKW